MSDYILCTNNLTKTYGSQKAVNQVSVHVKPGAIYGLIGKNGAGKTTFMKVVSGLANPSSGEVTLFGMDQTEKAQKRIGLLIENPGVYGDMSAFENLRMKAMAMGVYDVENIKRILNLVGLQGAGGKKTRHFSMGMKQRLGIGLALIGSPDMLILDEPINGLDPQGIIEIRELIFRLNRERNMTILISSHILEELSKVVTHYGIIDHGELLLEISSEELNKRCAQKLEITTSETGKAVVILEKMGIRNYTIADASTVYVYECLEQINQINSQLVREGIAVTGIAVKNEKLEDFFLKVTEQEGM